MKGRIFGLIAILIGTIPLYNAYHNPRLASARTGDMLPLIGAGMWFGIGLVWLFGWIIRRSRG